jgi:hypothetical protein
MSSRCSNASRWPRLRQRAALLRGSRSMSSTTRRRGIRRERGPRVGAGSMCSSRMPVVVLVSAFIDLTGPATRISGQSVSTTTFASCADQIREIIGDYFACGGWVGKDVLYVDDEGLYEPNAYFLFQGCGQELFPDIGVVAGTDDRGEIVSAVTTLDDLKQRIIFLDEPPRPRV